MKCCKTCKWWTEIKGDRDRSDSIWDGEKYIYVPICQRDCKCPKIVDISVMDDQMPTYTSLPDDAAGYRDSENFGAEFRPGPEFGCVHHETRGVRVLG